MMRTPASAVLALLVVALLGLAACGQGGSDTTEPTTQVTGTSTTQQSGSESTSSTLPAEEAVFTLEDLAQFDGKDGNPAYVAVDGAVYDVSDSSKWPSGRHSSCNLGAMAGQDLSETIQKAPANMRALLGKMPVVGRLAD